MINSHSRTDKILTKSEAVSNINRIFFTDSYFYYGTKIDIEVPENRKLNEIELFFPVIRSDTVIQDGKKLRGISRNKICVGVAVSKEGCIILSENTNKPSMESTWRMFKDHIKPDSIIVHDGENSHSMLIEKL